MLDLFKMIGRALKGGLSPAQREELINAFIESNYINGFCFDSSEGYYTIYMDDHGEYRTELIFEGDFESFGISTDDVITFDDICEQDMEPFWPDIEKIIYSGGQ